LQHWDFRKIATTSFGEIAVSDTMTSEPSLADAMPGFYGNQLEDNDAPVAWQWRGFLAGGQATLLTSQAKAGKTTLLSILLSRFKSGGELAGLPVAPTKAIVVSEESRLHWRPRHAKLDLSQVYFLCRPFAGKPTHEQWLGLLDHIAELRRRHGFGFLAIDTISRLLPAGSESSADACHKALDPLERLTDAGMSVLLDHHSRKGQASGGLAARGTSALGGIVDVTIEMGGCPGGDKNDRRRCLLGYSRSEQTPSQLVIELNAEGTDYAVKQALEADDFAANWQPLRLVLEYAQKKMDRREILEEWPADYARPGDATLWRWLDHAVDLGLILRQGIGRRGDPFRYWLPCAEEQFRFFNPAYDLLEQIDANNRKILAEKFAAWQGRRPEGDEKTENRQGANTEETQRGLAETKPANGERSTNDEIQK
jgi:AAA domain